MSDTNDETNRGEARNRAPRGEGRPQSSGRGASGSHQSRPYGDRQRSGSSGQRPSYEKRDGDKRPYEKRDGAPRSYGDRDGNKRPYEKRDGDKR
ncbi:hypothetical protein, partial [Blautia wexlerae]|uniref:hypothetical protein n=1 Tax=Blautia wexlerae TaxID=418240 RepID=UPI003F6C30AD